MQNSEKYYEEWIKDISVVTTKDNIEDHLLHHVKELKDDENNEPLKWAASMYNLLKIYELINGVKSTTPIQIQRLLEKYNKDKKTYTPPPGGSIPNYINVEEVN